ncbi:hypothetical protein MTYM_00996 [Methylococcales bacterium]|nr:hypothetical protein MTYM_00996 [Methylococcales bacterium]
MEEISLAQIRQLLDESFSDEEIDILCFDNFMEVYSNFTTGMTKVQKLLRLLSYCQSRERLSELIVLLNRARPGLLERRFPTLISRINISESIAPESESDSTEDLGYLDAIESFEDHFKSVTDSMKRMTEATQDVSTQMGSGTTQVNALQASGNTVNAREAKRVVNRTADDLETFAKRMEAEVPIFTKAFQRGIIVLNKAMTLLDDFSGDTKEQIVQVRSMLQQLETVIDSSDSPLQAFRNSIARIPRVTTTFNKSKRHAVGALDSLLVELARSKATVRDAQSVLNGFDGTES